MSQLIFKGSLLNRKSVVNYSPEQEPKFRKLNFLKYVDNKGYYNPILSDKRRREIQSMLFPKCTEDRVKLHTKKFLDSISFYKL